MAGEVTFRSAAPAVDTPTSTVKTNPEQAVSTTKVEVPFTDYARENAKPFSVEFFGLGDTWNEPAGGFPKEIDIIESYFADRIAEGEMANSVSAVKDRLKEIMKVTNMSKEERAVIKVETIAAYIKFLREGADIKRSIKRYGNA